MQAKTRWERTDLELQGWGVVIDLFGPNFGYECHKYQAHVWAHALRLNREVDCKSCVELCVAKQLQELGMRSQRSAHNKDSNHIWKRNTIQSR